MNYKILSIVRRSIPFAVVITILSGLVYVAVQQDLRQSANDPQIQMAEDAAAQVASGITASTLVPTQTIQIDQSLAPFLVFYNAQGGEIGGNRFLGDQKPEVPAGVFDAAKKGEDRLTWQPAPGVRVAAVVVAIDGGQGGYVLAGRNLRETEKREHQLTMEVLFAWLAGLILILIWFTLDDWKKNNLPKS